MTPQDELSIRLIEAGRMNNQASADGFLSATLQGNPPVAEVFATLHDSAASRRRADCPPATLPFMTIR